MSIREVIFDAVTKACEKTLNSKSLEVNSYVSAISLVEIAVLLEKIEEHLRK